MAWQDEHSAWQPHMKVQRDSETGLYRATVTIHDQHRLVAGQWASVVEDWADTAEPGMSDAILTLHRHMVYVSATGQRRWCPNREKPGEYAAIGRPQYWTGSQWNNVPMPPRVRQGNLVVWDAAVFSISYAATWKSVQMEFILKNANAARRVRWPVSLHNLSWNNWTLFSNGEAVGCFLRPRITSHAGIPLVDQLGELVPDPTWDGRDLDISTYVDGGQRYVEFTADLSGLEFPITISNDQETFQPGAAGIDATLSSLSANNNYGVSTELETEGTTYKVSLLEFDISSLSGTCDGATLYLYVKSSGGSATTLNAHELLVANDGWVEGTKNGATEEGSVCWATKAYSAGNGTAWAGAAGAATSGTDFDASALGTVAFPTGASTGDEFSFALTAGSVEDWFDSPNENYGMRLWCSNNYARGVCSSDHATAGYRPKLVVDYTPVAGGIVVLRRRRM